MCINYDSYTSLHIYISLLQLKCLPYNYYCPQAFNHTERIGPGLIPPNITPGPYLHIHVSREHILHDSMIALKDLHRIELKKRLRVSFIGEEGDDEGGLRKVNQMH